MGLWNDPIILTITVVVTPIVLKLVLVPDSHTKGWESCSETLLKHNGK